MMPEWIYLLKVNVGIALFYAFYQLFCRRDTFFVWRRTTLLSFLLLSFLYPLLNIQGWIKEQPAINELTDYYALQLMAEVDSPIAVQTSTLPVFDFSTILYTVYLLGVAFFFIRFLFQLGGIFYMLLNSQPTVIDGIPVRSLSTPANPFSFGRWIFLYLPDLKGNERWEILTHEQTHVSQAHSIDVILSELVNIVCWMNPFSWLLKGEIRLNLEYLADRKVVERGADTRSYQYHLLGLAYQGTSTSLYNNFNVSDLKNRIRMMNKKRTHTSGCIKYALFIPITLTLLLGSNVEAVGRTAAKLIQETSQTEIIQSIQETIQPTPLKEEEVVYQIVEEQARFPGGMKAGLKYIQNSIIYPEKALKERRRDRVIVQFVVLKDGSLQDIKVMRGKYPDLNAEAVRVIKAMPNWLPGKMEGEAVPSRFILPIAFKLPKSS